MKNKQNFSPTKKIPTNDPKIHNPQPNGSEFDNNI